MKNQPAFPTTHEEPHGMVLSGGLTIREYFMSHAPAEPQPWFKPIMGTPRPASVLSDPLTGKTFATWQDAEQECGDDYVNAAQAEQDEWDYQKLVAKYAQWPAAWADAVLKATYGDES